VKIGWQHSLIAIIAAIGPILLAVGGASGQTDQSQPERCGGLLLAERSVQEMASNFFVEAARRPDDLSRVRTEHDLIRLFRERFWDKLPQTYKLREASDRDLVQCFPLLARGADLLRNLEQQRDSEEARAATRSAEWRRGYRYLTVARAADLNCPAYTLNNAMFEAIGAYYGIPRPGSDDDLYIQSIKQENMTAIRADREGFCNYAWGLFGVDGEVKRGLLLHRRGPALPEPAGRLDPFSPLLR
jgi:hypothetical protein